MTPPRISEIAPVPDAAAAVRPALVEEAAAGDKGPKEECFSPWLPPAQSARPCAPARVRRPAPYGGPLLLTCLSSRATAVSAWYLWKPRLRLAMVFEAGLFGADRGNGSRASRISSARWVACPEAPPRTPTSSNRFITSPDLVRAPVDSRVDLRAMWGKADPPSIRSSLPSAGTIEIWSPTGTYGEGLLRWAPALIDLEVQAYARRCPAPVGGDLRGEFLDDQPAFRPSARDDANTLCARRSRRSRGTCRLRPRGR